MPAYFHHGFAATAAAAAMGRVISISAPHAAAGQQPDMHAYVDETEQLYP